MIETREFGKKYLYEFASTDTLIKQLSARPIEVSGVEARGKALRADGFAASSWSQ